MKTIILFLLLSVPCFSETGYIYPDPLFHQSQKSMKYMYRYCALAMCLGSLSTYPMIRKDDYIGQFANITMIVGGGFCFVASWYFE